MALIDQTQLDSLRELAAGDESFLVSVIDAFLPQLESFPDRLRKALVEGDSRTVVELAHSLKGSAGNVGAEDLYQLCLSIEQLAREGDLEKVVPLADELDAAAVATHQAYEAEKGRIG